MKNQTIKRCCREGSKTLSPHSINQKPNIQSSSRIFNNILLCEIIKNSIFYLLTQQFIKKIFLSFKKNIISFIANINMFNILLMKIKCMFFGSFSTNLKKTPLLSHTYFLALLMVNSLRK